MRHIRINKRLFSFLVVLLVCGYGADAYSITAAEAAPIGCTLDITGEYFTIGPWTTETSQIELVTSTTIVWNELCYRANQLLTLNTLLQAQRDSLLAQVDALENEFASQQSEANEAVAQQDEACEITEADVCDPTIAAIRKALECPHVYQVCIDAAEEPDADDVKVKVKVKPAKKMLIWKKS